MKQISLTFIALLTLLLLNGCSIDESFIEETEEVSIETKSNTVSARGGSEVPLENIDVIYLIVKYEEGTSRVERAAVRNSFTNDGYIGFLYYDQCSEDRDTEKWAVDALIYAPTGISFGGPKTVHIENDDAVEKAIVSNECNDINN